MRRRFVTLDVFAGRRFAGNPLAVVLEAEGLDGDAVQTIAREFNLPKPDQVKLAEDHRRRRRLAIPRRLVGAYGLTTSLIVEALVRAKERGVDVRLIIDKTTPCERESGRPDPR